MQRRLLSFLNPWVTAALAIALSVPIARVGDLITFFPDSLVYLDCDWAAWQCNNGPLYPAMMQLLPMPLVAGIQQLILGLGIGVLALVVSHQLTVRRRLAVFVFLGVALQTPGVSYWSSTALTESIALGLSLLALASLVYFFQRRGRVLWPLLACLGALTATSLVSSRVALAGCGFMLVTVILAALLTKIPGPRNAFIAVVGIFVVALAATPTVVTQTQNVGAAYALGRDVVYGSYSPSVRAYFDEIGPICSVTPTSRETAASQCPERATWWAQGHPSAIELLASGALTASAMKKEGLVLALVPPVYSGGLVTYSGIDGAVTAPANKSLAVNLAEAALLPFWVLLAASVFTISIWRRSGASRAAPIIVNPFSLVLLGFLALVPLELVLWSIDGPELPRHLMPWQQIVLLMAPILVLRLDR